MPNTHPNPDLCFEQGEVVYENTRVMEWVKFWQTTGLAGGAFFTLFVPYNLTFKTNLITDAADEMFVAPYHLVSPTKVDITHIGIPISVGAVAYVVYTLLNFMNALGSQYVVKMTYSKDKVKLGIYLGISVCKNIGFARTSCRRCVRSCSFTYHATS